MKRLIASASLIAVGAVSVHGASASGVSGLQTSKPWSVSASLRGFYDDNYTNVEDDEQESFGIEVRPSVSLNLTSDQTYLGLSARYSMKWYEDRDDDPLDHTVQLDAILDHSFSERFQVDISDSFVIAQEPEILDGASLRRTEGDNIRNRAAINFSAQLTRLLSGTLGYENTFWDYEQDESDVVGGIGSRSALLDRMQHVVSTDLRWQALRNTVALAGYQFSLIDYTADELIAPGVSSDNRNNIGHYVFVGADHSFSPDMTGSIRAGGRYTDYYNASAGTDNQISPYVDGNLTYVYTRGSDVYVGVRHDLQQTDFVGPMGTEVTTDIETTTAYAGVTHQFNPRFIGTASGRYSYGTFNNGAFDGDNEHYLSLGLSLRYLINQYLSTEAGYSFDNNDSDIAGRDFTRNRVFIGITATY